MFEQLHDLLGDNFVSVHFHNLRLWFEWLRENRLCGSPCLGWLERNVGGTFRLGRVPICAIAEQTELSRHDFGPVTLAASVLGFVLAGRKPAFDVDLPTLSQEPLARNSGALHGKRTIWGGRPGLRRVLYMAALVACRHNAVMRAFYERLRSAGKSPVAAGAKLTRVWSEPLKLDSQAVRNWIGRRAYRRIGHGSASEF